MGLLEWPNPLMPPELVEIRRQLVESRTVIADTRSNVVNSPELGFKACYIVATRTRLVATRAMSPCLTRRRECTISHNITTRSLRHSTNELRDQYDLGSSHFRRRVVARILNSYGELCTTTGDI